MLTPGETRSIADTHDSPVMRCPTCAGFLSEKERLAAEELIFWRNQGMPVLCHILCRTRSEARSVPRGDMELTLCGRCGLVYNRVFDANAMRYRSGYENALHFSPHFCNYADALARRLIEKHGIQRGRVLEIGCGDGQFLEKLCRLGNNRGLGIDPAYDPQRSSITADVEAHIVGEPFNAQMAETFAADLICCRHVLEHLHDPLSLLGTLRAAMRRRSQSVVYFEVPNVLHILKRLAVWDVIYEHCLYLSPATLGTLFRAAGFEPIDSGESYGGQFAWIEAVPGTTTATNRGDSATVNQYSKLARSFAASCADSMAQTAQRLETLAQEGRTVAIWGAGSKTVTMLNVLAATEASVSTVVDQNPRKHGHHIVGTGHPIIAPGELPKIQPHTVVLMNPLYHKEVAAQLTSMSVPADLLVA